MRLGYQASGLARITERLHHVGLDLRAALGMAAVAAGARAMIPVSLALVLFANRMHPHWLHSVQPGFRWRYAFGSLLIAVVVIGGVWLVTQAVRGPLVFQPSRSWAGTCSRS